jgi:hypothetical protein
MTNPYRAMCAELAEELVNEYGYCTEWEKGLPLCESNVSELLTRARALLAQPEPKGPTDEELVNFRNRATADCCASRSNNGANLLSGDDLVACQAAGLRAVLAKYGSTTPQLVAEGPTDDKLMDIARATDLVYYMGEDCGFASPYMEGTDITAEVLAYARAALAKWGHQ